MVRRDLKINLFTNGDCRDPNTWSSLPYYFYKGLVAHKVQVNPIDLIPSDYSAYTLFCYLRSIRARAEYALLRTKWHYPILRTRSKHFLTNQKIQAVMQRYDDVDLNVFLTFSFSSYRYSDVPVVHYCDRTYEHHLEEIGQSPTRRDRTFIEIDRRNVENADLVLTTNQLCCDFIHSRYKCRRVSYLGGGTNTEICNLDAHNLIAQKEDSKDILFIGRGVHRRGVDILIGAFSIFNARHEGQFTLHVVGVRPEQLPLELQTNREKVRFYPYLDRTVPTERDTYDNLMRSARLFVCPMRPGPMPNVIQEAQFYCTPVIMSNVSNASESVKDGHSGFLVDSLEPEDVARYMDLLIEDKTQWRRLAYEAHASVKDRTWWKTAQNFLEILVASDLVKEAPSRIVHTENAENVSVGER